MDSDLKALEQFVLSKDKAEAIKDFPDSSKYKTFLKLILEMQTEDITSKLQDKNLTAIEKSRLTLAQLLKNLDSNIDIPNTLQKLMKEFSIHLEFSPPRELARTVTSSFPSILDQSLLLTNFSTFLTDKSKFNSSKWQARIKLDPRKMSKDVFNLLIKTEPRAFMIEGVIERLASNATEGEIDESSVNLAFSLMTLDELEKFESLSRQPSKNYELILAKLRKKYRFDLHDCKELYAQLNNLYMDARNSDFQALRSISLLNLLVIGPKLGIYDEGIFREYLSYHRSETFYMHQGIPYNDLQRFKDCSLIIPQEMDLLTSYFDVIFSKTTEKSEYEPFFDPIFLQRCYARSRILAGSDPTEFSDIISTSLLQSLANLVILKPSDYNSPYFLKDDLVNINITTKNINQLVVKVIEINTKSYYLENLSEISTDMNLDGIVVAEEYKFVYDESPLKSSVKSYEFSNLTGKRGSYIIEFTGNGLQCRVLVKKGSLRYVSKITAAGQSLSIFDENNTLCKTGGVYIDKKFYPIGPKFYAIVPFSPNKTENNSNNCKAIILTDNDIFELKQGFDNYSENFSLKCSFFVHNEQLLLGKTTEILIQPKIFINNVECGDFMISNLQACINTMDCEGLLSSKVFDKLKISPEMIKLEMVVPGRLTSLEIEVKAELNLRGKKELLTDKHTIVVNSILKTEALYQSYMKYTPRGYIIEIKGRNGELWRGIESLCTFSMKYHREAISTKLASDENGEIFLGRLKGVTDFNVNCGMSNDHFDLLSCKPVIKYPKRIHLSENDKFQLPFYRKTASKPIQHYVSLIQTEVYKINHSEKLIYLEAPGLLCFPSLEPGEYLLNLPDESIPISVVDGLHWGSNEFILTNSSVLFTKGDYSSLSINSIERSSDSLQVGLSGDYASSRLLVLYCNYLSPVLEKYAADLSKFQSIPERAPEEFSSPKAVYVDSRVLDPEIRYVLERRQLPRFVGNTLPRPQILSKRQELGYTVEETKENMINYDDYINIPMSASCSAPRSGLFGSAQGMSRGNDNRNSGKYFDFLENQARWKEINVVDGIAEVPDLDGFGLVFIIATNGVGVASRVYCCEQKNECRDLTAKKIFDSDKAYIEKNLCSAVVEASCFTLSDCENSFQLIDSLEKLYSLQKEIYGKNKYHEWRFLSMWDSLSVKEKEEKCEKYLCHELNIFIYHKDPDYFARVIRPFLACKLEKTIIDKYLLSESLEAYEDSWSYLNALEKVVFISWLKSIDPSRALNFDKQLKDYVKSHPIPPASKDLLYKKVFQMSSILRPAPPLPLPPPPPPSTSLFGARPANSSSLFGAPPANSSSLFGPPPANNGVGGFSATAQFAPMNLLEDSHMASNMMRPQMPPQLFGGMSMPQSYQPPRGMTELSAVHRMMPQAAPNSTSKGLFTGPSGQSLFNMGNQSGEIQIAPAYLDSCYSVPAELDVLDDPDEEELKTLLESQAFYKKADATKEYIESNYYKNTIIRSPDIPISLFWAELSENILKGTPSVLTESVLYATSSLTELIAVLSFSSLPFSSSPHQYSTQGKSLSITAASNLLIFYKDISVVFPEISGQVLAAHRYFKHSDKYVITNTGEKIEKTAKNAVKQEMYDCNLIITNISEQQKDVNVLQTVPEGSIPINPPMTSRNIVVKLMPYSSNVINYSFYFPAAGNFEFFSANVAEAGKVVAIAGGTNLVVYDTEKIESFESFADIVASGTDEKIFEYLENENPFCEDYDLKKIYFKLKSKEFYTRVIEILRSREIFDDTAFMFSFIHGDAETAKLAINRTGMLKTMVKDVPYDFLAITDYTHYEYNPLINARVYQLGKQVQITNPRIVEVYKGLLLNLAQKCSLTLRDKLIICQYLIYQDKREKAAELFSSLIEDGVRLSTETPGTGDLQLQIDYMGAYLTPDLSESLAKLYADYPVKHWRDLFSEITSVHLETSEDPSIIVKDEPTLDFSIEDSVVKMNYINVGSCVVRLYLIDLEMVFSKNPFLSQENSDASYTRPSIEISMNLDVGGKDQMRLPTEYSKRNMIVEVDSGVYSKNKMHFATEMKVNVLERIGVVKVIDRNNRPRPGVYVKVYAREKGGAEAFYKDGYTDIRGKFDFVSLNTDALDKVAKFAILVTDDHLGSLVVQANPPPQ